MAKLQTVYSDYARWMSYTFFGFFPELIGVQLIELLAFTFRFNKIILADMVFHYRGT